MWTLESALEFVKNLRPDLLTVGYDIGLTGSILYRGDSSKDIDVILYPWSTERSDVAAVKDILKEAGLKCMFSRDFITKVWRKHGSDDNKHVEGWMTPDKRRVDFFFVK